MSAGELLLLIAGAWILAGILVLAGWARAGSVDRRPSWDLTRRPGYFYELERRRRNARRRGRVRVCDAGGSASRPARRDRPERRPPAP